MARLNGPKIPCSLYYQELQRAIHAHGSRMNNKLDHLFLYTTYMHYQGGKHHRTEGLMGHVTTLRKGCI